jgi:hypothetical protein
MNLNIKYIYGVKYYKIHVKLKIFTINIEFIFILFP